MLLLWPRLGNRCINLIFKQIKCVSITIKLTIYYEVCTLYIARGYNIIYKSSITIDFSMYVCDEHIKSSSFLVRERFKSVIVSVFKRLCD